MDLGLAGCTAVVTGGSRGIGRAIVASLASEGAQVIFCGRSPVVGSAAESELVSLGLSVQFVAADTETDAGVDAFARTVLASGPVDILINNVGGSANPEGAGRGFLATPSGEWTDTYYKCVVGAVRLVNLLAPAMKEKGWGRIINISSAGGLEPAADVPPEYAAAKAAMNTMTMSLSRALAHSGITVNAISPGPVLTEGFQAWMDGLAEERGWGADPAVREARFLREILSLTVNRLGRPEDIGAAVAFVASRQADFINGSNLRVDGGLSHAAI
jgi:NAD(P)-dependent dehydrogenase (short-subunit alcohol dehydrogenase family)